MSRLSHRLCWGGVSCYISVFLHSVLPSSLCLSWFLLWLFCLFSALRAVTSSVPFPTVSSASPPLPSVASASSTRLPPPLPLPAPVSAPSGFMVPPFSLPPVSQLGGGVLSVGFCSSFASGSYRCFFSLHCLATSVCASSCGSFFLSSCFPASGFYPPDFSLAFVFLDVACLFCSWLGLSSAGFSGSLFTCGALHGAPLFSATSVCSAPIGSSAGLYGFTSPLSRPSEAPCLLAVFAPGRSRVFSGLFSYSFCTAPLASAAGFFGFPSASAGSFIDFVGSTPQPGSAPLSGTSTAPSLLLSQCLVRVLLSLWSGFVAQVAPGAVAPVPETFVLHLCLPPLSLVSDLMVAILTLAASSSQAPLPACSFSWSSSWSFCS